MGKRGPAPEYQKRPKFIRFEGRSCLEICGQLKPCGNTSCSNHPSKRFGHTRREPE